MSDEELEAELAKYAPDDEPMNDNELQRLRLGHKLERDHHLHGNRWSWPSVPKMPSINWKLLNVLAVTLTLLLALSALGVALAALLGQKSVNTQTGVIGSQQETVLTSNECDSYFFLDIQVDASQIILPVPHKVSGCTFQFVYARSRTGVTEADATFTTEGGEFVGPGLTGTNLDTLIQLQKKSVVMEAVDNVSQLNVISDGTNYRIQGLALNITNMS